jgi:hypothetical protein
MKEKKCGELRLEVGHGTDFRRANQREARQSRSGGNGSMPTRASIKKTGFRGKGFPQRKRIR